MRRTPSRTVAAITMWLGLAATSTATAQTWEPRASGTTARFRGISVVSDRVAWASGTGGTVIRTVDGGQTWTPRLVPDAAALDLRDIEAFDDRRAVALSIGEGEQSRIYRTGDGGASWQLAHINRDPKGFLDAIAFWDDRRGLAVGDPVDGRFTILATDDGGQTWAKVAGEGMPPALAGEGAFAASGTCLVVGPEGSAWFATGGAESARVFRSTDRGRTWAVEAAPLKAGIASAGVFGLAFRDKDFGLAVGGDYKAVDDASKVFARTDDGGRTWALRDEAGAKPSGFRSALAFGPGEAVLAVGPSGSDLSKDGGRTWAKVAGPGFHAAAIDRETGVAFAAGDDGRVARLAIKDRP